MMAEIIGIASAIAGLISLTMEITQLSYKHLSDIRSAHSTQKQYLREVSALTEVLLHSEEAVQSLDSQVTTERRPAYLSQDAINECAKELEGLRSELTKTSPSIFWPLKEKILRKHIEDLHRFRSTFSGFIAAQTLIATSATHREVSKLGQRQTQVDLLEWIGTPKDTSSPPLTPYPGTGEWFLKSNIYRNWVAGEGSSVLWCHGPPGVGKSMLASLAYENLSQAIEEEPLCLLRYFCDFPSRKEQKKEAIWRSLLRQAIEQGHASILETLTTSRQRLGTARPASWKDLSDALALVCSTQNVILLFDGPDELENPKDMKAILHPFLETTCRILVTSRDVPEIRSFLNEASNLEVQADRDDLRTYIVSQFEENDLEDVLETHPELEREIVDKSNGIFLLGKILVDHLLELTTVKQMRKALQNYPIHLDQAFESSLERINAQSKFHSSLAHRVIGWITSAERKLSVTELLHGLAIEEGIDIIDEENLITPKTLLKVCGGLVVINSQDNTVNMVHSTVYEWFRNRDSRHSHADLARSCLRYLTMRPLLAGSVSTAEIMSKRLENFPFLPYAAQHWHKHILDDQMECELTNDIDILLGNEDLRSAAFQASNFKGHVKDLALRSATFDAMPTGQTALHISAYWNLARKTSALLELGEDVNASDSQNWTPLHWASFGKSHKAINILLASSANIDAEDSVGWTPLFWTALHGDLAMVELLLHHNANHVKQDIHGWTPLRWAAARKETRVMEVLLRHHSDKLSNLYKAHNTSVKPLTLQEAQNTQRHFPKNGTRNSLLKELDDDAIDFNDLYAVLQDDTFDIRLLWNEGHFDPPVGNAWRTLSKAERHQGVGGYIAEGALGESESTKSWRTRLLHAAIRDDQLLAVKLLLELGADVNDRNSTRRPLHAAAFRQNPAFAEILIQHGANTEAVDYQGLTALQQAVMNGFEKTVEMLLSKGARVNATCADISTQNSSKRRWRTRNTASTKTPLMLACGISAPDEDPGLSTRIIRLLLEHGADVSMKDAEDQPISVVHYAARSRNPRVLETLMDAGADVTMPDDLGRTAAHHLILGAGTSWRSYAYVENPKLGMANECLELFARKFGIEFLDQAAEWDHHWETQSHCWSHMKSIHTPLSLAMVEKDWGMVRELHKKGAQFKTNIPLESLLRGSVLALEPVAVDILLQNGASFSSEDTGWMANLYSSTEEIKPGEQERLALIIQMVLPHGFDINAKGWSQQTLLHYAVSRKKSYKFTETLLQFGADPCQRNSNGLDSFILACLAREFDILRCLLKHIKQHPVKEHWTQHLLYSDAAQDHELLNQICTAISASDMINLPNDSATLLCRAASLGDVYFAQALLENGADFNLANKKGQCPIHFAAKNGNAALVQLLLRSGANVEARDEDQKTALHVAARYGHSEVVELLLSNGAALDVIDSEGWQPLHFSSWKGQTGAARSLIEAGAPAQTATSNFTRDDDWCRPSGLYAGNQWTGTPLHLAAMSGNIDIVRLLLADKSVDVAARTDNFEKTETWRIGPPTPGGGPTALHIALDTRTFYGRIGSELDRGRLEIASTLVEHGASVQGVANHLWFDDLKRFEGFPGLWDILREGISK